MLKEILGDLLELPSNYHIIAHGCNCFNTMGAGIAREIAEIFPEALDADTKFKCNYQYQKLGNVSIAKLLRDESIGDLMYVANCYTQYQPGPHASLAAIELSMFKLAETIKRAEKYHAHPMRLGLPLIGCGIGGLSYENVRPILQRIFKDIDATVVHYKES